MAKYRVQGPDGKIHVFEGPDGASQDQVLAFANQQFSNQKPAAVELPPMQTGPDDPGAFMAAMIGAGRTSDQIVDGMKQLYFGAKSKFETPTLNDLVLGGTPSQLALKQLEADQQEKARLYKPLQEQHSIATAL